MVKAARLQDQRNQLLNWIEVAGKAEAIRGLNLSKVKSTLTTELKREKEAHLAFLQHQEKLSEADPSRKIYNEVHELSKLKVKDDQVLK